MKLIYAHEHTETKILSPISIFLAGPSPRSKKDFNWRPEAIQILSNIDFGGNVYIPLPRNGEWSNEYDAQVDWELKYLEEADAIAFWIPRDIKNLPGFTTNVEFGLYARSHKIVLGYPENAPKMKYLHHVAEKFDVPISNNLQETLVKTVLLARAAKNKK